MKQLTALLFLILFVSAAMAETPVITAITPPSGPSDGGTEIVIHGSNLLTKVVCIVPCPPLVAFGDIVVPAREEYENRLVVVTPAHPPATVDLTVTVTGEAPVTVPGAFTFLPDEDDAYGRILLPVHLDGVLRGAHGTEWRTDLWVRNNGSEAVLLAPWPCAAAPFCPAEFPLTYALQPARSLHNLPPFFQVPSPNPSRILYVRDPAQADLSFGLRFADTSRSTLNAGAELPVVREGELLVSPAQLLNVPVSSAFRLTLRIYDLAYTSSRFRVSLFPQSETDGELLVSSEVVATTDDTGPFKRSAAYAQLDLTSLATGEWPATVRIQIEPLTPGSRYWSVASITNNDTQLVTLVTPQ